MLPWSEAIGLVADQHGFAGVVSVDRGGEMVFARAFGFADRAHQLPNTVATRFAIASGTKGLTALTVVSLIDDHALDMSTTARSVLGTDLPLIGDDVTIEHLLSHRSGIGDYLDEEAGHEITDYVLAVPPHELATTEQYLAVLGGHPARFPPDERFCYRGTSRAGRGRTRSTCPYGAAGTAEPTPPSLTSMLSGHPCSAGRSCQAAG